MLPKADPNSTTPTLSRPPPPVIAATLGKIMFMNAQNVTADPPRFAPAERAMRGRRGGGDDKGRWKGGSRRHAAHQAGQNLADAAVTICAFMKVPL